MDVRPWHSAYPSHIPTQISYDTTLTLNNVLLRSFELFADRPAIKCGDDWMSYGDFGRRSKSLGKYLFSLGLKRNDRVAIMLPNSVQYPVCMSGILLSGMVVVNVNPLYTAPELAHQLNDSGAKAIVIAEAMLPVLRKAMDGTDVRHIITVGGQDQDNAGDIPIPVLNLQANNEHSIVPLRLAIGAGKAADDFEIVNVSPQDIAFLQYTGGTTGVSKGAILTHGNLVAQLEQLSAWIGFILDTEGAICVTPLPLYHIFPLVLAIVLMKHGVCNRLVANPRDPIQLFTALKAEPFVLLAGVNTLFNSLVASDGLRDVDFSKAKMIIGAGASIQQAVADRWQAATGVPIAEAYGLSETSPGVTFNVPGLPRWTGTIGVPLPSTDVILLDEDSAIVPVGSPGELCVKGPQVFPGYWRRPDETLKVFTSDGWFRTGDIATMDDTGHFRIVDRKKDMILVSGFNVYPNEIEAAVALMPDILECACVGVVDSRSGEAPHLFVVPKIPNLTPAQIEAHCREHLTGYKIPRYITIVDSLPKSTVGKILRKDLRESLKGISAKT